jgi:hypothetical protein
LSTVPPVPSVDVGDVVVAAADDPVADRDGDGL